MDREQRIAAFVDGELDPDARAAFDRDAAADPRLAADVERQRRLRARLAAAFDPVLHEPIPPALEMTVKAANDPGSGVRAWRTWGAIAASLVAGVLLGRLTLPDSPLVARDGRMVARGELARTLETALAADAGPIRVGLTFRRSDGGYCRTFESGPDRLAGLACRADGRWVAETVTAAAVDVPPEYRTAGAETPPEVLAAVDRLIAGDPLDAAAERTARGQGWREAMARP
jgi:hypothetical protein